MNGPITRPTIAATTDSPAVIHGPAVVVSESSSSTNTTRIQNRPARSRTRATDSRLRNGDTRPERIWRALMMPAMRPAHALSATAVTASRSTCTSGKRPIISRRRLTSMMSHRPVTNTNRIVL